MSLLERVKSTDRISSRQSHQEPRHTLRSVHCGTRVFYTLAIQSHMFGRQADLRSRPETAVTRTRARAELTNPICRR